MTTTIPLDIKFKNLTGRMFSRLTVVAYAGKRTQSHVWHCRCTCGVIKIVYGTHLVKGATKSCGCIHKEFRATQRGQNHPNWNPNRQEVIARRKMYGFMCDQLRRLLFRKTDKRTHDVVGYKPFELIKHIENQFDSNMTWDNYGTYWEIDHIKSVASFLKDGVIDPKIINSLVNLRPLSLVENRRKGMK